MRIAELNFQALQIIQAIKNFHCSLIWSRYRMF